jgi:uncharacterized protein (TIGR01777 family)
MSTITRLYRTPVDATPREVFGWHANPAAFGRLTPPWMRVTEQDASGAIGSGDWKLLRVPIAGPLGFSWKLVHADSVRDAGFVDVQERGPFASWKHEHRFRPDGTDGTMLEDFVTYELPYGIAGQVLAGRKVERMLDQLFRFRHQRTRHDVELIARNGSSTPLRVAVTGASGLVGRRLVSFLEASGHDVVKLVRHAPRTDNEVYWNPATPEIDAASLEGLDAVVHLAGVSIAGGLWTRARKDAILNSRVDSTELLATTLASLSRPPKVFVSTSAVGYYGDSGNKVLTERSPAGVGFLADVCQLWEHAARSASDAGIRVVHPRFGLVMAGDGGMLPLISMAFKAGVGGPLGGGQQYMSWIALDDLVDVLYESVTNESLQGPINAVSPYPVSSREFAKTLGRVLKRPSFFPAPAPVMRLVAGQLADELILVSQRAEPEKLLEAGFAFRFSGLEDALRFELGREEAHFTGVDMGRSVPERQEAA